MMDGYNSRLADTAEVILLPGAMSWELRHDEHVALLERTFGRGRELLTNIHTGPGTECAVFVGACAIESGVVPRRGWPAIPAITTWTGFGGFGSRSWVPYTRDLELLRGDVLYWCGGTATTWPQALNGHVGIARLGSGTQWLTAEGGGGVDGTTCKLSSAPKDVTAHSGRPLRGVWRPDRLQQTPAMGTPLTLRKGSRGEQVKRVQRILGITVDGVFGSHTEGAVRSFQIAKGLVVDGIIGSRTWAALEVDAQARGVWDTTI